MIFENINYWFYFFIIPIFIIGEFIYIKYKNYKLKKFGEINLIKENLLYENEKIYHIKWILYYFALFFLIISLLRPQYGAMVERIQQKGIDVIVALDVSESMRAEDIKPNRLLKAKSEIKSLINNLKGDRIGIVIFSGSAHLLCPLTHDYNAAKMFVDTIDFDMISRPGTSIASAIFTAIKAFNNKQTKHKTLILITDGEDHEQAVLEAIEEAKKNGIIIHCIGIGGSYGVPIPIRDAQGNIVKYKEDKAGNQVLTKLDILLLQKIALETNGSFYNATPDEFEIKKIYSQIENMDKKILESKQNIRHNDIYQYFLIFTVLFLIIETFLPIKLFASQKYNKFIEK
ncbi:MAG TPA: VWA domain-containing protein [bacterium]|nr:VWA domain-containing protein [bacterium]HOL47394.1 VWA domain-containing protein [bacterium]HPQ18579.1 VWA domain-containing protein [bacterium]